MADEINIHDAYTAEEKKMILERLDAERRARQSNAPHGTSEKVELTHEEKEKILEKINEERRIAHKYKELQKTRLRNKKVYHLENKDLYKFIDMERAYYIQIDDSKKLSSRPQIITLYFQGFDGLRKKDVLMQVKDYSDKIFISDDMIKVYFKQYALEDNPS